MKGKTSSGFEFEIDEKKLNDMRLLDMIVDLANGDAMQLSPVVVKVLGKDQRERLYEHLEEKEGRASIERVSEEVAEIFSAGRSGKNSSPSPE